MEIWFSQSMLCRNLLKNVISWLNKVLFKKYDNRPYSISWYKNWPCYVICNIASPFSIVSPTRRPNYSWRNSFCSSSGTHEDLSFSLQLSRKWLKHLRFSAWLKLKLIARDNSSSPSVPKASMPRVSLFRPIILAKKIVIQVKGFCLTSTALGQSLMGGVHFPCQQLSSFWM